MIRSLFLFCAAAFFSAFSPATGETWAQASTEQVSVPQGTVLRLALSARTSIGRVGQPLEATVVEPVYLYDRIIIPVNTKVLGRIIALNPVPRGERIIAMTGGDFTPLHDPVIQFDRIVLNGVEVQIDTEAVKRNTRVVRLRDPKSRDTSAFDEMRSKLREALGGAPEGPGKMDCFKNFLFSSLPYHPQVLDRGNLFDAVLQHSVEISVDAEKPARINHLGEPIPPGTRAHARLLTDLNSAQSKPGTPIRAVLTEPIYGPNHELLYPEGTELTGSVTQVHSARWPSKSGEMRFAFNSLRLPAGGEQRISGQLDAVEAARESHVTIDEEGGTRARMGGRFLAPIYSALLGTMATTSSNRRIKRTITSDGFRIIGRAIETFGPTGALLGLTYYGFARQLYLHLLRKGPEVDFPANTRLELLLSPHTATPLFN